MFEQINLLFTAGTIEDDRDSIVLQTICNLIEQNQKDWKGYTLTEVTDYCLGVSLDTVYAALPLTMGTPNKPDIKPALTITQTVQSLNRLQHQFLFIRNEEEFEVICLHRQLLMNLNRALDLEAQRLQLSIAERTEAIAELQAA